MIDWNKYQAEALTTAIYPLERELDYTILGLCSEVAEVAELVFLFAIPSPELKSEVGDCFWYAGAVADALGTTLQQVWDFMPITYRPVSLSETTGLLIVSSGHLAGLLKKTIRDDSGKLTEQKAAAMMTDLTRVLQTLVVLCGQLDTTPHAVTQANLNKLADRKLRGVLGGSGDAR